MNDAQLRIGDAEREQAAAALGDHFAQGRLSADEHGDRLDRVWAARTRADLAPVFRDLPGHRDPRRTAPRGYWSGGPRIFPGPLLLVLGVLITLTVLTHLPFVLVGLLVAVFVMSRRRHRRSGPPQLGWR
ncbi:DUF1707 SHOCT-like domain-containing protein [Nocardioides lianchengensis]|uniref:DUF1707 domain-containing protein n=1 Tax=Nocardioides lianchengensis TaxID=1045774 RepID=A0A1G6LB53_9ACTN|nr:DUF1707 domain-containing protein [Nocardioides lianchengensis]NYG12619.1 Flp pilus assembly protein TadB [Nocardioides lianchengensis]SDC40353.1 protein of unknown function [Nocardioides lianchengensis]